MEGNVFEVMQGYVVGERLDSSALTLGQAIIAIEKQFEADILPARHSLAQPAKHLGTRITCGTVTVVPESANQTGYLHMRTSDAPDGPVHVFGLIDGSSQLGTKIISTEVAFYNVGAEQTPETLVA
ncbi:MAG TPA: hypothetical protein VM124_01260 [Candidatus Limnocylindrales bacterium]|nr:hypothetical protein [Candidatus Limnocylindrales bacterium]